VLARNLGFQDVDAGPAEYEWDDSKEHVFTCRDTDGRDKPVSLVAVRVFKNGNMHLRLLPEFVHALNTRHGKLKGWLRSREEAEQELDLPENFGEKYFDPSFRIGPELLKLGNA
jgi:hypothetical protein